MPHDVFVDLFSRTFAFTNKTDFSILQGIFECYNFETFNKTVFFEYKLSFLI